jgi:hypothetical protein
LLRPRLDPRPQLGQALLALSRQLLHRDELLLHRQQLGAQIAPHLDEIGLLSGQLLLQQPNGGQDRVPFRRSRRIAFGEISL